MNPIRKGRFVNRPHFLSILTLTLSLILTSMLWTLTTLAGAGWERLPTDEEIGQAASAALASVPAEDWTTLKRHDPNQPVQNPVWVNSVLLVWIEPNPNYPYCDPQKDPNCKDPGPPYWCGVKPLEYENGWRFAMGDGAQYEVNDLSSCISCCVGDSPGWIGGETPPTQNRPPTVSLTYSPTKPMPEDTVHFDATASDPDGDPLTYQWYLNGKAQTDATQASVTWSKPPKGTHTLKVVVSDGKGGMAEDSVTFTVGSDCTVSINGISGPGCSQEEGCPQLTSLGFSGSIEGCVPPYLYFWDWGDGQDTDWAEVSQTSITGSHAYECPDSYEIQLIAEDHANQKASDSWQYLEVYSTLTTAGMSIMCTPLAGQYPDQFGNYYIQCSAVGGPTGGLQPYNFYWDFGEGLDRSRINSLSDATVVYDYWDEGSYLISLTVFDNCNSEGAQVTIPWSTDSYMVDDTPGVMALGAALDADGDGELDDAEIMSAIQYWILGQTVAGADQVIDDAEIRELIQMWILGTPVTGVALSAASADTAFLMRALGALEREVWATDPSAQRIEARVFDLSGRLLIQESAAGNRLRFALRSNTGGRLPNGIYLYIVTAQGPGGGHRRSEVGKLVVLK